MHFALIYRRGSDPTSRQKRRSEEESRLREEIHKELEKLEGLAERLQAIAGDKMPKVSEGLHSSICYLSFPYKPNQTLHLMKQKIL